MTNLFDCFLQAFPPNSEKLISTEHLEQQVSSRLAVRVPLTLCQFWNQCGVGYFGEQELYVFGDADGVRDSLVNWNSKSFWKDVAPSWDRGRPLFFAETCFGEQIGFRYIDDEVQAVLYVVDTNELFIMCNKFDDLFQKILISRDGAIDLERLISVRKRLGVQPAGHHYASIVPPLVGGTGNAENFSIQTPNAHFRTAIATMLAIQKLPPSTKIQGIDITFE